MRRIILVLLVCLALVGSVAGVLWLKLNSYLGPHSIVIHNDVVGFKANPLPKKLLSNNLSQNNVLYPEKVNKVTINISSDEIIDPVFTQKEKDGNILISSSYIITDKELYIWLYLDDSILETSPRDQAVWVNSGLNQILSLVAARNMGEDRKDELNKGFHIYAEE